MIKFIKNFFIFLPILLALSLASKAEIINKVEVEGNKRITKESIIIFGDIIIGDNYESDDVSLIIKKLYSSIFFLTLQ